MDRFTKIVLISIFILVLVFFLLWGHVHKNYFSYNTKQIILTLYEIHKKEKKLSIDIVRKNPNIYQRYTPYTFSGYGLCFNMGDLQNYIDCSNISDYTDKYPELKKADAFALWQLEQASPIKVIEYYADKDEFSEYIIKQDGSKSP